jgi:hypothetical protein
MHKIAFTDFAALRAAEIAQADMAGLPVIWRATIECSAIDGNGVQFEEFGTDKRQLYERLTSAASRIAALSLWQDNGDMASSLSTDDAHYTAWFNRVLLSC